MKKAIEIKQMPEDLPFAPPELDYLSECYVLKIPMDDKHLESPWKLRVYTTKILQHQLGDEVQLTSLKVKKPHLIARGKAKLRRQTPTARLYVTVKF